MKRQSTMVKAATPIARRMTRQPKPKKKAPWTTTFPDQMQTKVKGGHIGRRYRRAIKEWLLRPENVHCIVQMLVFDRIARAIQVHHWRGRIGSLLMDQRFWLPCSAEGHYWIHANPKAAKLCGLIAGGKAWNVPALAAEPALSFALIKLQTRAFLQWKRSTGLCDFEEFGSPPSHGWSKKCHRRIDRDQ